VILSYLRTRTGRRGFTLIELLVVIAIIAILIGLLLPAVQKVREAAARIKCTNNFKQLGIACHAYNDVNQALPPAVYMGPGVAYFNNGGGGDASFGPNWLVMILPFVEQDNLYKQYADSIKNYQNWVTSNGTAGANDQNWRGMRSTVIKTYQCPSDSNSQTMGSRVGGSWARGNYAANAGPGDPNASANGNSPTYTQVTNQNVVLNNGARVSAGGVMTVNWGDSVAVLTGEDGTSNTIMINHIRSGPVSTDMRGCWAFGMIGGSWTANAPEGDCYTPNDTGCCSDDVYQCSDRPDIAMGCWNGGYGQATARSQHTGGVIAGMGDGSARFIRSTIDIKTWFLMLSRNDGLTYVSPN
jgi:prepilin-type N-terminal cleavage/methylation domain-containing protein